FAEKLLGFRGRHQRCRSCQDACDLRRVPPLDHAKPELQRYRHRTTARLRIDATLKRHVPKQGRIRPVAVAPIAPYLAIDRTVGCLVSARPNTSPISSRPRAWKTLLDFQLQSAAVDVARCHLGEVASEIGNTLQRSVDLAHRHGRIPWQSERTACKKNRTL